VGEHCSYKTRAPAQTFPTRSPRVWSARARKTAGIIDIGDGLAIAFKIESHTTPARWSRSRARRPAWGDHPRLLHHGREARLRTQLLRFGPHSRRPGRPQRRLFWRRGQRIAHYGNWLRIPTIAGEVYFDASYEGNPLVNVFCWASCATSRSRARGQGCGQPGLLRRAATGRDGLAGAAFASRDLTEEIRRPAARAVQVGDPFMEKLVCEACLGCSPPARWPASRTWARRV